MRALELLAPAKNLACGIAAIDHGADAVYIGAERFGARVAAGNPVEDIAELCRYAHQFGAKVYVTTNTIIYDEELEDTFRLMSELREAGVDAFLVQDMGIVQECRSSGVTLHASTQTDNRSAEKVEWLRSVGFRRVVLARELSLEEIREIHRRVPDVELEVFVHGALCVSYSGQCYASEYCLGRSANRGACAQMCRMKYDLIDADGREIEHQRYLLSLKDMCRINDLEALADAGAVSFKIEGRLKDADYVKNVVAAYSQRLDEIVRKRPDEYRRTSFGKVTYMFTPNLRKTFNRDYTDYFLHSYRDEQGVLQDRQADIASFDSPKALGEYVGEVKSIDRGQQRMSGSPQLVVDGESTFSNGDGLCFFARSHNLRESGSQGELVGFRVNRADGNRLFLQQLPQDLKLGTKLYRNNDVAFSKLLAGKTAERKIPVTMRYGVLLDDGRGGSSISLDILSDVANVSVAIPAEVQHANRPQMEIVTRELSKLGNTPFQCMGVTDMRENSDKGFLPADDCFVPVSELAQLRRFGVENLTKKIQDMLKEDTGQSCPSQPLPKGWGEEPSYLMNVSNRRAREFYEAQGVPQTEPAFELKKPENALLMQCRHCIKFSLGYCVKYGGKKPGWKEPLRLRLGDGRLFRLEFDCKACLMKILSVFLLLFLVSCYGNEPQSSEALPENLPDTVAVADSLSFKSGRHYTVNYNFVVKEDSILLLRQQPEELAAEFPADSFSVAKGAHLVVADIRLFPGVGTDSVWVQVATEQSEFGWIHESQLLQSVVPDDPISQFISFFSDTHVLFSLVFVIVIAFAYGVRLMSRRRSYIVLFKDIESFYPTLLTLIVAFAAAFYASIQNFAPDVWRHFYYNPTLNPFSVPLLLAVFLFSVWSMLLVGLAAVDDVRKELPLDETVMYLVSLAGFCAVDYIVFSITTLYYIGYLLLIAYTVLCLHSYNVNHRRRYVCGNCGKKIRNKGRCPYCGVENL